jgi:transcriptional regulator with XRE-family HTH domain
MDKDGQTEKGMRRAQNKERVYSGEETRKRLRELIDYMRDKHGWRQADFARKVGISTSRLSHYLAGTYYPQIDALTNIASKLGISLEWLIYGKGPVWIADLENPNTAGTNETILAIASLLTDIADNMRQLVLQKNERPEPADTGLAIENALAALVRERLRAAKAASA